MMISTWMGRLSAQRVNGIPLYVQVREQLREELSGLKPGEMIPSELLLGERFGVSRITIRKAIDELVADHLLVRRQGSGTFVERPKLVHELNAITSWTEQMKELGYIPRTAERKVEEMEAPKPIARLLQIGPNERLVVLRRLRLANEEPITLMVNYIPSQLVLGFRDRAAEVESLYELLANHYGLVPSTATDTVETRSATDTESERLRIEPWAPILKVTRVTYLEDERPLEVSVAVSRGDRYEYRVKLRGRTKTTISEAGLVEER